MSTRRWRFLPLTPAFAGAGSSCPHRSPPGRSRPPFFRAFHALAVDHAGARRGRAALEVAGHDIELVVQALQRAVELPQHEIVVHRRLGRQILGQRAPLAARLQNIENPVHHLAHIGFPLPAPALGRRDQRRDQRPLAIGQITRIARRLAFIISARLGRPHVAPPRCDSVLPTESQVILSNQELLGRALKAPPLSLDPSKGQIQDPLG